MLILKFVYVRPESVNEYSVAIADKFLYIFAVDSLHIDF